MHNPYNMLALASFKKLSYQEKKDMLITICTQVQDKDISFEDTIFLLEATNIIREEILIEVYQDFMALLEKAKTMSQEAYQKQLEVIQEKMQKDQERESTEADSLLSNI
jgi:hypothetical protein